MKVPDSSAEKTGWVAAIVRQPLAVFVIGAALIFLFDALVPGASEGHHRIEATAQQQARLTAQFEQNFGRPPTASELEVIVANWVEEEALYRQALALDLGEGDPVVRRYLISKMNFLTQDSIVLPEADDQALMDYYAANAETFTPDTAYVFRQVLLKDSDSVDAQAVKSALNSGVSVEDLPVGVRKSEEVSGGRMTVSREFGTSFYESLSALEPGVWQGPVQSAQGFHLVHIDSVSRANLPDFEAVRDDVLIAWQANKRAELEHAAKLKLMQGFEIDLESGGR